MNGNFQEGDIVLGEWKLAKLLGQGSYGKVFAGEREDFGVIYRAAIKIITIPQSQTEIQSVRSEGLDEASVTAYFRSMVEEMVQEFGIMSKLKGNSNIVSYEDHRVIPHEGEIGWDIIIRMEQLTPMLDYMGKRVMEPAEVAKVGIDMCRALELCVRNDIIHRDIKPENMFVNDLGDYKLGDFGIARTIERNTGAMSKKGTYTYMAPEIYKEEPYDARVDIYSLGIVLYRLLNNNRPPFLPLTGPMTHSQREQALLRRISGAPLPPPSTPCGALADIVLKACAYKPDDRWSDPTQMREALERYVLLPEDKAAEDEEEEEEGTVRASAADLSAYLKQEDEGTVSAVSYAPRPSPKPAQQTGYQVPRPAAPTPAPAAPTPAPAVTPAPAPAAAPATRPAATPAAPPEPAPAAPAADLPFFASPSFSRPTAPAPAAKPS